MFLIIIYSRKISLTVHPQRLSLLRSYLSVIPYLSAARADFATPVEIETLPKQSINQEVCQSKAGGINQSCELTAEVWHHNKSRSSANSVSYSQEEVK